jgi:ElaB/YqjD/DUF883 family membrane-anchored ribosome-binding protein
MLVSVLLLFAQDNNRQNRPDAKQIMETLTSSLELTSEQQESISPLVDEQFELMKSHGEPGKSQSKGDREKFKNSMDEINEQISELLNEDQQKEYKKIVEDTHNKHEKGQKRP